MHKSTAVEGLKFALLVWLLLRLALSSWGVLVFTEGNAQSFANARKAYPDAVFPAHDTYGYLAGVWNVYDTRHYTTIAEQGYAADPNWLPAYFPGFPLLIKALRLLTFGDSLSAGLLIANLSAIVFFWYLYRLTEPQFGSGAARRAVVFSAVFPASFFLFLGYGEATFLAFTVGAFYYAEARKWWLAGILGGAAALTKQPGIFLIVPFAYMYIRTLDLPKLKKHPLLLLKRLDWLPLLLVPLAAALYTLYRYLYIKAPITGATDLGGQQELEFPGMPLVKALGMLKPANSLFALNLMDIVFTVAMIALVLGVMKKVPSVPLRLYSLVLLVANLALTMYTYPLRPEINMPRRALIIFPIFIFLGIVTEKVRPFRYTAAASFVCMMLLCGMFLMWVFVS